MRKYKTIKFQDKEITCKELSIEELAGVLEQTEESISAIDLLFPERLPVCAVKVSTGLTDEALAAAAPSELEVLLDAVEEVNPFFLQTMQRLAALGVQTKSAAAESS